MSEEQDVKATESESSQGIKDQEPVMRPAVDIFEDETGITVQADMPGVSKDGLEIHMDSDSLSISGKADILMVEGMEALHAEITSARFERSFALSSELDADKADASLKDGVLTLRIPKREQYKPRKIEVRVE